MNRAFHPERWTDAERINYLHDRLHHWAEYWRSQRAWVVEFRRRWPETCREFFRSSVTAGLQEYRTLHRPRYRHCHCGCRGVPPQFRDEIGYVHWPRQNEQAEQITEEEVAAWIAEDPFERAELSRPTAKALCYLERFNPNRHART